MEGIPLYLSFKEDDNTGLVHGIQFQKTDLVFLRAMWA